MTFYNYFIKLCTEKNVAPSRAALDVGLSKAAPNGWKVGRTSPTDVSLQRLADYFSVNIDTFWNCEDIAAKREKKDGLSVAAEDAASQDDVVKIRQQLLERPEMKILFDASVDAPASAIYEAVAHLIKAKEGNR